MENPLEIFVPLFFLTRRNKKALKNFIPLTIFRKIFIPLTNFRKIFIPLTIFRKIFIPLEFSGKNFRPLKKPSNRVSGLKNVPPLKGLKENYLGHQKCAYKHKKKCGHGFDLMMNSSYSCNNKCLVMYVMSITLLQSMMTSCPKCVQYTHCIFNTTT